MSVLVVRWMESVQDRKNVASFMIELISSTERDITTQQFVGDISDSVKDIAGAEITL